MAVADPIARLVKELARLPGIGEKTAQRLAFHILEQGQPVACEASIGVACFPSRDVAGTRDLLRFAHSALARAKEEGRGRICLYQYQGYLLQPQ